MKTQQFRWWVAGVVVFVVTAALWWRLAEARREREAIEQARRRLAAMEEARRHHAETEDVLRRLEALSTNRYLWDGTLAEFRSRITDLPALSTNPVVRTNFLGQVVIRSLDGIWRPHPVNSFQSNLLSVPLFGTMRTNLPPFSTNNLHKLRSPYQQIDTPPWPKTNHTAKSIFAGNERF